MSRITAIFTGLRDEHRRALMPFLVAGYPGLDATEMLLSSLHESGAAIAEVGIPFSDPIADGPVIAAAMHQSLASGTTVDAILAAVRRIRPHTPIGLVAMVSQSIVHRRGGATFVAHLADAGFDGLIIPDVDLQAADALLPAVDAAGLSFSTLIAPTTTEQRLAALLKRCRGFIYLLARTGLTGTRADLPDLAPRVEQIRRFTELPIAAGFGISTPAQVREATRHCDAAIVGSALVRRMAEAGDPAQAGREFVEMLASGLTGP
ncbi:MAG: tryptophan synthase subunit alpha [Phycisphaerales bacterium]|jgi:tryptophan synthase alpha chain|nr:tryptophan synthase subunit alpha [Phycisphaerales bacterium]